MKRSKKSIKPFVAAEQSVVYGSASLNRPTIHSKPKSQKPICLPPSIVELFGIISDTELARRANCNWQTISKYRKLAKVPPAPRKPVLYKLTPKPPPSLIRLKATGRPFLLGPEIVKLLGNVSDSELAHRVGCGETVIRFHRHKLGIKPAMPHRAPYHWGTEAITLLGEDSDRNVGLKLGIPIDMVMRKRRLLGIPAYGISKPLKWSRFMLGLLGKYSDKKVGRQLGLGVSTVRMKRVSLKIPPYVAPTRRVTWTPEMISFLKILRTTEFSARFGIHEDSIVRKRRVLGIPPPPNRRKIFWSAQNTALIGTMPDAALGRMLGISTTAVYKKRMAMGLLPFPSKYCSKQKLRKIQSKQKTGRK